MKILIIEDEQDILDSIYLYFNKENHVCEKAPNFTIAKEKIIDFIYDIVILDINLPDGNGLDLLKTIKEEHKECGVIVVSAKNSLDDKIKGLDLGADDYITKPFHLSELNSRIKALIRRRQFKGTSVLTFNEIELDAEAQEAKVNSQLLPLTQKEFALLLYFVTNKNRVITKNSIAEHLWGDYMDMANNYDFIYTHIRNLRKKINDFGGKDYLKSIYGLGYKYTEI